MAVKNKRVLKEITKRWIQGTILMNEALISFQNSGLSDDEIKYIQEENDKIASSFTDKSIVFNVDDLVNQYYK